MNINGERVLFINSIIDRTPQDLTTTSWTTYLNEAIKIRTGKIQVMTENIEIANTSPSFHTAEYIFYWVEDYGGANTLRSIEIDRERFFTSGNDFCTYMNNQMTAGGYNLQFTYLSEYLKIQITNNETVPIRVCSSYRFSDPDTGGSDCHDKIGLTQDLRTVSISPSGTLRAEGVLRLLRTQTYYLTCDIIGNNYRQSILPSPYYQHNIISRITANNQGSLSQLQFSSSMWFNVSQDTITAIKFQLLDDQYNPIDIGQAPITFVLKIIASPI